MTCFPTIFNLQLLTPGVAAQVGGWPWCARRTIGKGEFWSCLWLHFNDAMLRNGGNGVDFEGGHHGWSTRGSKKYPIWGGGSNDGNLWKIWGVSPQQCIVWVGNIMTPGNEKQSCSLADLVLVHQVSLASSQASGWCSFFRTKYENWLVTLGLWGQLVRFWFVSGFLSLVQWEGLESWRSKFWALEVMEAFLIGTISMCNAYVENLPPPHPGCQSPPWWGYSFCRESL